MARKIMKKTSAKDLGHGVDDLGLPFNEWGLTFERWEAAANYGVPPDLRMFKQQALEAWQAGEDPSDYAARPRQPGERNVDDDVLAVLARMKVEGQILQPVSETLPRALYERLNKVLEGMGGKWKRGKGHVFADVPDLADRVEAVLATGNYHCQKTADQLAAFFRTPEWLAKQLAEEIVAKVSIHGRFLEPSAGDGRLAMALLSAGIPIGNVLCVESDEKRAQGLQNAGFETVHGDFLGDDLQTLEGGRGLMRGSSFRGILMNPPFTRGADIKHVHRALTMRDARFCFRAIMSAGILWKQDKSTVALREYIKDLGGTITPLPPGTFASEGTEVQTCVVRIG